MKTKECIYDIREALKLLHVDSDITDRHIMFLMNYYRSMVIRQHISNNPGEYRNQLTQSFNMRLATTDGSRYPSLAFTGITILATVLSIPNIVGEQMYKELEVRTLERLGQEIEIIDKVRAAEIIYAPNGFIYGWREDDGKLYIVSNNSQYKSLQYIVVTAILEKPEDILLMDSSLTELEEYPLTHNLWVNVKELVLQHLGREMTIPTDTLNNERDDQTNQSTQK
jgi:hypothetical protein